MEQISNEHDSIIENFKIKKLINNLKSFKGNGTSLITLVISPKDQISKYTRMLTEEYNAATNIKSRSNKLAVLTAITSVQQKLKLYNKVPENGLIIYSGIITVDNNKEKKITYDIIPSKPISRSTYLCDSIFHTEDLEYLLQETDKYGFIIIDGKSSLFATLSGRNKEILYTLKVDLPNKHNKGGQSSVRFSRLREETRHNYLTKVSSLATKYFITNNTPNIKGLILGGSADFKNQFADFNGLDSRLKDKIISIVDLSYGGKTGLNTAIELSKDIFSELEFVKEKKIVKEYFDHISQDTNKYSIGINQTIFSLNSSLIESLLISENTDLYKFDISIDNKEPKTFYMSNDDFEKIYNKKNINFEIKNKEPFIDWIIENYKSFNINLYIISDNSHEGKQFEKSFGGIGSILRYSVNFIEMIYDYYNDDTNNNDSNNEDSDEYDFDF